MIQHEPSNEAGNERPAGSSEGNGVPPSASRSDDPAAFLELARLSLEEVQEALSYLRLLAVVQADRARFRMGETLARAGLLTAAALALVVLLASAVVLSTLGLAGALTQALGGPAWSGQLAGGLLLLLLLAGGAWVGMHVARRAQLSRTKAKYDEHERRHRARFGHYASDRDPSAAQRPGAPGATGAAGASGAASHEPPDRG